MTLDFETLKNGEQLLALALPVLIKVLSALAIFFIGKWLAAGLIRLLRLAMGKAGVDATLIGFLSNVLYGVALAVVIVSALGQIGVDTTSAAAVLGGAALAIGLSLQGQLSSLAAGVILIVFRPFRVGDFVQVGGITGVVEEIKIIATVLRTLDNQEVTVPNASITSSAITNFNARATRRIDLTVGIAYSADLRKAKQILQSLLAGEPRVLKSPEPTVEVKELADNSVNFAVRGWTHTGDWWATRCALLEAIKLRFDAEGVEIPYPQLSVHVEKMPDGRG